MQILIVMNVPEQVLPAGQSASVAQVHARSPASQRCPTSWALQSASALHVQIVPLQGCVECLADKDCGVAALGSVCKGGSDLDMCDAPRCPLRPEAHIR